MTCAAIDPGPTDQLLTWLAARGQASRGTVERACRALADRSGWSLPGGGAPIYRYLVPLLRLGHVEAVLRGYAVVSPTLLWTSRAGRGILVGARDEMLRANMSQHLAISSNEDPWPTTWEITGDRGTIDRQMSRLKIAVYDDPGLRLLAALPSLEEAIEAWPAASSGAARSEVMVDLARCRWSPVNGMEPEFGLIRPAGARGRGWTILRAGVRRLLNTSERHAVGWWGELARLGRPAITYDRSERRLRLPASPLTPPTLVERPLVWASGQPPARDAAGRWIYEAIDPDRASEVGRILGLPVQEKAL